MNRCLTPTRPSKPKLPGKALRMAKDAAETVVEVTPRPETTPRLPAVRKRINWEKQDEWWSRRDNRLRPYMKVRVSYLKPDGSKAEGEGVLLSGWGVANKVA